jgi:hypothetical protein
MLDTQWKMSGSWASFMIDSLPFWMDSGKTYGRGQGGRSLYWEDILYCLVTYQTSEKVGELDSPKSSIYTTSLSFLLSVVCLQMLLAYV